MPSRSVRRCRAWTLVWFSALLTAILTGCSAPATPPATPTTSAAVSDTAGQDTPGEPPVWPSAAAVTAENALPGDPSWQAGLQDPPPTSVEGFADRASITPGEPLTLRVRSTEGPVSLTVYRMGWYAGDLGRKVATAGPVTTVEQPDPTYAEATRTFSAAGWTPGATLDTADWPPGDYLIKLVGGAGSANLVPVTVRATSTSGAVVILNANTTWQAYNTWGGRSLYKGPSGGALDRAYAVSFDRPISYGAGAGDFRSEELPLLALAEKLGLTLAYATDTDLHADPELLTGARAVISLGHDEYYSQAMRDALTRARDAGTNIAFLGANAVYRHIRLEPTDLGPHRLEIGYKNGDRDPILATDPKEATYEWRRGPFPRPESELTGAIYQCNPVSADLVVAAADSWLLAGTGLAVGDTIADQIGSEYDQVTPGFPTPRPMQVIFHSPVTCRGVDQFADAVYYTVDSGAGVFNSGTSSWICGLAADCVVREVPSQRSADLITTMTTTLLTEFAAGPAGQRHPALDNLDNLQINSSTARPHPAG